MIDNTVIELSRLQFAFTAIIHFIFVPLTIGLSIILAIMESIYVKTGNTVWRDMTKFWGTLFGINFALGVATGITMEFQFGTNWSYYSYYVGDIFGIPLAIEGLMAFFLEATFIGLFFFGWNKLSKKQHHIVTWLVSLGTSFSALWILIANGWMQHPVGAHYNLETMRMEIDSISSVILNPVAQAKFLHTIAAAYVTGSIFVLSISAYYLLRNRCTEMFKKSILVASLFGLFSIILLIVLGDESGYLDNKFQHMKTAAIEGVWTTEKAPSDFLLFGLIDQDNKSNSYEIKIPYVLGIIANRSMSEPFYGIKDMVKENQIKIADGLKAYKALEIIKANNKAPANKQTLSKAMTTFEKYQKDLGYALLLRNVSKDIIHASTQEIQAAAETSVPKVWPLFLTFRLMVGFGFYMLFLFSYFFFASRKGRLPGKFALKIAFLSLVIPFLSAELGWFVAEFGRQPWVINEILPTFLGASSLTIKEIFLSFSGFLILYTFLTVVEFYLMIKYIKLGPEYILSKSYD